MTGRDEMKTNLANALFTSSPAPKCRTIRISITAVKYNLFNWSNISYIQDKDSSGMVYSIPEKHIFVWDDKTLIRCFDLGKHCVLTIKKHFLNGETLHI